MTVHYSAHTGTSMNPTLSRQDLLEIEPCGNQLVRVGDVIIFNQPGDGLPVIHRIIKLTQSGICTRGDSNSSPDRYLVQPNDIIGRVVAAWRGKQRRTITGGRVGLLQANLLRRWKQIDHRVCAFLYPLYEAPARSGITSSLLPARLRPRVVAFQTDSHRQLHLLLGPYLIGHYEDNWDRWFIRRPFRLIVDERLLPSPCDFSKGEPESVQSLKPFKSRLPSP